MDPRDSETEDFSGSQDSSINLYLSSEESSSFEDFKIVKLIGKGSFGKVYFVHN